MPDIAPVAVLGGGIAGAAACLRFLHQGIAPLWIAPPLETTDKPGEHLAPAARPILAELGILDLLDRACHRSANTMFSAWGDDRIAERNAIVHLEGPATVLDRLTFERDLRALVLERGAAERKSSSDARGLTLVEASISDGQWRDGRWCLTVDEKAHQAGFVVDATGRAAVFGRDHARRFRADQLAGLFAFLERDPANDVEPSRATLIESVAGGWWYAALLADGRLALNYYTDPDLLPKDATRDPAVFRTMLAGTLYINRWVQEAGFRVKEPPRLASAGTTWIAPVSGERWVAIGDAASAFDPLSSHGMTTALWSARAGADAVTAVLQSADHHPLSRYTAAVAGGMQAFLTSRDEIYGQEKRFADQPFWQRRHLTSGSVETG